MNKFLIGCAVAALATPAAYAQSTGSDTIEANDDAVVITGSRLSNGVAGVVIPDVPKTRSILTQEFLSHQGIGNTVLNAINQIPGVNFTNTDPYGSSGGNLRIRGFPGNRVALLFDGLPLNDTGNYAIYSNQQLDPEIIDQVSVNLGTTDVDSPTPSAAGGVISYRTRLPGESMGAVVDASVGRFDFNRVFGMIDTGVFTSFGTRAFFAASNQRYDKFSAGRGLLNQSSALFPNGIGSGGGELTKQQYNVRIYQPIGTNGDFISVAGHYNRNRNAFYVNATAAQLSANRYVDNIDSCTLTTPGTGTVQNDGLATITNGAAATGGNALLDPRNPGSCTNYNGLRINPSNTGNVRISSRFTLADNLILTVDPGYQYTLANGGGTTVIAETDGRLIGTSAVRGVDLNGDGDTIDSIRLYTPSNTRTNRYTILSSLIYSITDAHRVRLAYTFDRGQHRQTGDIGRIDAAGNPISVFGGKNSAAARILSADGTALQTRDRYSVALLHQVSGEYFGRFLDDKVTVTLGLRAPFFKRELDQNCFTQVSSGNVLCTTQPVPANVTLVDLTYRPATGQTAPTTVYYRPFERTVKYSPLLPSAGVSFNISGPSSIYFSYGRNFSAPSTDNLYRSAAVAPLGEITDNFEAGYRYRAGWLQAQLSGFWNDYQNRIVSSQDVDTASPTFGTTIDRNVGDARAYGFEASVAVQPTPWVSFSPFLSFIDTKIKENVVNSAGVVSVQTAGAQFAETPKWQFGGRIDTNFGPVSLGAQYKYVGKRFATDDNGRTGTTTLTTIAGVPIAANGRVDAYNLVDVDARFNLDSLGLKNTYIGVRVDNIFNEYYLGNINSQSLLSGNPTFRIGSPRTWQATFRVGF